MNSFLKLFGEGYPTCSQIEEMDRSLSVRSEAARCIF